MSTQLRNRADLRVNLVLAVLFVGTFVLGTSELIVVGLLNLISADLRVSIPAAGALVTANALGLAVGGPILTVLTIRMNRRTVLIGALTIFILATVVAMLTNYGVFLVARAFTGAVQGLFIAAAFAACKSVVPPERMGRAMSAVISGITVSAALGVPLGTLLSQALGWRGSFIAVVVLAAVTLGAIVVLVPSVPPTGGGVGDQAKYAFAPRVLVILGLTFLVFSALFAALTYLVPFLQHVTGIEGATISVFLLAYGVATAVGSFGGGRFADVNATRTIIVGTMGLSAALLALYLFGTSGFLAALTLSALGLFGMGIAPAMQYRLVSLAGPGGDLAQSLPASAGNAGVAFGATAGGFAIGTYGPQATVITGFAIAVLAVGLAWATRKLTPPS